MAKFTGTYVTGDAKGIREDLTDMIYDISPTKTPMISMIGRSKAKNTLHEWQQDELAAAITTNAVAEGNEATFATPTATVRLGNYVQISDKTAIVSGTLEVVDKAGRKSEMSKQLAKRSAELKRDMALTFASNQPASGSDPRKTAGLLAWLKSNTVFVTSDGTDPVYTTLPNDARGDSASPVTLTEAMLKSVVQSAWDEGAEPNLIFCGAFQKDKIASFAGIADQVMNLNTAKPGTIIATADVYVSHFGALKVVPNRFQRTRDVFVIDPEYMSVMYLRPFSTKPLAKTGDAEKRLLNVEWGSKVHTEAAHGAIYDLLDA
jgi:hypothetical protein